MNATAALIVHGGYFPSVRDTDLESDETLQARLRFDSATLRNLTLSKASLDSQVCAYSFQASYMLCQIMDGHLWDRSFNVT